MADPSPSLAYLIPEGTPERRILPKPAVNHNTTLFSFGNISFRVISMRSNPALNIDEYAHVTSSDYARKLVMGANPQREFTGEGDEELLLHGLVFPRARGGFSILEALEAQRRNATAQTLIRGGTSGGQMLGWFVLEHLERRHTQLWLDGVGQVIAWRATFARVDQPDAANYYYYLNLTMGP